MRSPCLLIAAVVATTAAAAAGCTEEPKERRLSLAEIPSIEVVFRVTTDYVGAKITYSESELGTCAILGPDFAGRVNDLPMKILFHGAYDDLGGCDYPDTVLLDPPAASAASLHLSDSSRTITCDLGAVPALRSTEAAPASPRACICFGAGTTKDASPDCVLSIDG